MFELSLFVLFYPRVCKEGWNIVCLRFGRLANSSCWCVLLMWVGFCLQSGGQIVKLAITAKTSRWFRGKWHSKYNVLIKILKLRKVSVGFFLLRLGDRKKIIAQMKQKKSMESPHQCTSMFWMYTLVKPCEENGTFLCPSLSLVSLQNLYAQKAMQSGKTTPHLVAQRCSEDVSSP